MLCFQKQSTKPKMATATRDPITTPSTKTTLSSFLSIDNSQPTTTTKLHKLLFKTIQKRNGKTVKNTRNGANDENNYDKNDKKKRKWSRARVTSPKRSSLKALFGKESPFVKPKEVSGNWEGKGKQPIDDDNDERVSKQSKFIYTKSIKVPTFLADFFDRKCSVNSTDALKSKLRCSSSITSRFPRFPFTNKDIEKNNNMENEPVEESVGDGELCKKRILMGEKCKPLTSSGILHYDVNGLLLIED